MQDVARFRNSTKFPAMNFKIAIVFLQLLTTIYGDFELACDSVNPSAQTDLTCVCRRTVGSGIKWFFNGNSISDCILNSGCLPQPIGYTFSINVSEFAYEMTKSAYDYNNCTQINCTDASNTNTQLMVVPSAINFDPSNPSPISEPTLSHSNGNISITTGCISGYTDVTCEWYTVDNGVQEKYTYGQFAFNENDKSACSNCNNDVNAIKTCGFYHIEASGNETKNVNFRVVLTHTPTNFKWEVNSANVYTIKATGGSGKSDEKNLLWLLLLLIIPFFVICGGCCFCCVRININKPKVEARTITFIKTDKSLCCKNKWKFKVTQKANKIRHEDISFEEEQIRIQNLTPATGYKIKVSNSLTYLWKTLTETTKIGVPDRPKIIRIIQVSEDSIIVQWTPGFNGGAKQTFTLQCSDKTASGEITHNVIDSGFGGEMKCTFKKLKAGHKYSVSIMAYNTQGYSPCEKENVTISERNNIQLASMHAQVIGED